MIKIKLSTPWNHVDFNQKVGALIGSKYQFYFGADEKEVDFWIIWGGIKTKHETAICPKQNVIYLTDEAHDERFFNKFFLNQFEAIITCRTDIVHRRIINTHELNTWMVQGDYDWLYNQDDIPKSKTLSVVSSNHTWLPGHKLRFEFVSKLKDHFKDKIDLFGRGINPITDKYNALAPYRYSIAIENSVIPGYFTEKLADCYLTHTMPIYYGCPDVESYFDSKSLLLITPSRFSESVFKIEQLIEENNYDFLLPLIKAQKKRYLENYHIFNKLVQILEANFTASSEKKRITVKSEQCFQKGYWLNQLIKVGLNKMAIPPNRHFQLRFDQANLYANKKKRLS